MSNTEKEKPGFIFPEGFLWGTTTSAYQIEGGWDLGGKGESVWDHFTHMPGRILNNDTGDVACDHYRRYKEDVALLRELGVKSYMFSIAWPRIFPNGIGKPNKKGMAFYHNLVELLLENGIKPIVNLFHWEMPQQLQYIGGWTNRNTIRYFERYACYVFKELGNLVPYWVTFSEPWVSSFVSYWFGGHPPGIRDYTSAVLAAHNIMLAHGRTVQTFRKMGLKGEIGISLNLNPVYPASEAEQDIAAAGRHEDFLNNWFLEPLLKGKYPEKLVEWLSDKVVLPKISQEDMNIIKTPIDFLGVNNYSSASVFHNPSDWPLKNGFADTGKAKTDSGWEVYPEGLYDLLLYLHKEYTGLKLYITENGVSFKDIVGADGSVEDNDRLNYLNDHIIQVHKAMNDGVNIIGYHVWSFLDNFEWNLGYSKRFGLVHVDYETQKRTIKKSGRWYSKVIADNGITTGF